MSLLSAVVDFLKPAPPPEPRIAEVLARVPQLVDPMLGSVGSFAEKLTPAIDRALNYCAGLVDALPGPVHITRQAFSQDPLVHALFATADDIDQMLGRSQAVRDYLAEMDCWRADHFYALLAARRQYKKQLGMSVKGEVIHNDVPQVVLYFSDHTLLEPSCDLDTTLHRLRQRAIDSLLTTFRDHVQALRHEREGLRADLSVERAHLTVLQGQTASPAYQVHTRHLAELDTRLRQTAESLMPEPLIDALAEFLHQPETSIRLKPVSIRIDRLGIVCSEEVASDSAETLNFPELTTRDQRQHLVMLARIDREEARAAVERVRDQQHRFMII